MAMTEKEILLIVKLIAEEMEDIHKGSSASGFTTLRNRLKRYSQQYDRNVDGTAHAEEPRQ